MGKEKEQKKNVYRRNACQINNFHQEQSPSDFPYFVQLTLSMFEVRVFIIIINLNPLMSLSSVNFIFESSTLNSATPLSTFLRYFSNLWFNLKRIYIFFFVLLTPWLWKINKQVHRLHRESTRQIINGGW